MKAKKADFQEKRQKKFRFEQRKIYWLYKVIGAAIVAGIASIIILGYISFFLFKHGILPPPMTENDIGAFSRIHADYSISFWWNIPFGAIWAIMIYWIMMSSWLKKEAGKTMQISLAVLVFAGGLYFSIRYGGILYGLIVSLIFLILLTAILLSLPWLIGDEGND